MTPNNYVSLKSSTPLVVNYFQNLYLCDFQQQPLQLRQAQWCCELLSKFVSLWFPTTANALNITDDVLWITFKICIFVIENNLTSFANFFSLVVNYFQNLYLCDSQQQTLLILPIVFCCELLSKFVPLWLPTTVCNRYF